MGGVFLHPVLAGDDMYDYPMVRFSIAPTGLGAWLWRTFDQNGQLRAQGLAATRKLAAALVIRDIVAPNQGWSSQLSAKAA
ncbi:hypothetical protein [Caulobacter soli]|uniref:hypothetical protein n=1 Tax=Caulobacter soli TaxID=2708539 RepID=UPI0013EAE18E|nr:hypothetical protein [Caulobacter soli]